MALSYHYQLDAKGRATIRLTSDCADLSVNLDTPADHLAELAEVAWNLAIHRVECLPEHLHQQRIIWEIGGRRYRWEFHRTHSAELAIEVFCASPDSAEELAFYGECTLPEFALAVLDQLVAVLLRHGFAGFRNRQVYQHFPLSQFFRLRRFMVDSRLSDAPFAACRSEGASLVEELGILRECAGQQMSHRSEGTLFPQTVDIPSEPKEPFRLRFQLQDAGWADAWVSAGGAEYHFGPGYMSHALEELSHAAVRLLWPTERRLPEEGELIEATWEGEPPRLHWEFLPRERGEVEIRIHYIEDPHAVDDRRCRARAVPRLVLQTQVTARYFGRQVLELLERVLLRHGLEGYRDNWIEHEFPLSDYLKLNWLLCETPPTMGASLVRGFAAELDVLERLAQRSGTAD